MLNRKIMLMAVFLVGLLAISAVSANDDVLNETIESDNSILQLDGLSDADIESADEDSILELEDETNILESADENAVSMDENTWFYDRVVWYDGDYDYLSYADIEYLCDLKFSEKIVIHLSDCGGDCVNVDLAFLDDYDNKITKLTTDSNGIAIYHIPFDAESFSFCVGFWYNQTHLSNYGYSGQTLTYAFDADTWYKDNTNDDSGDDSYGDDDGGNIVSTDFYDGSRIRLDPLYVYLPEVPEPYIPWSGVTIDFTKPVVDENYPRFIDLSGCYVRDDAMNRYGSVELVGKDLIVKSLDRDNYTVFASISDNYYFPYSYASNGLGGYDAHINLGNVSKGNHNVQVVLYGDPDFDFIYRINYHPVVVVTLPIFMESSLSISSQDSTIYSGGKYSVVLTNDTRPVSNVWVQMSVNGEIRSAQTDANGRASISLPAGEYNIVSSYGDVSTTSHVVVNSTVLVSDAAGSYLNSKVTTRFLNTDGSALSSQQVTFKAADKTYSAVTDSNGAATADIDLGVGTYTVTAVNPVNNEQKQFILTITKAASYASVYASQNVNGVNITAALTPATATGRVTFSVTGGRSYEAVVINGKASVNVGDLAPGNYEVTANYGGDLNLEPSISGAVSFKVDEIYPILDANDLTKDYGSNDQLAIVLKDNRGNAIANAIVNVAINDKTSPAITNNGGLALMAIDLVPGTYYALVSYEDTHDIAKITVNKASPKITASQKTFKAKTKTKKYSVSLKSNGKAVANAKVTLKVNGKKYSALTKANGKVTFKLKLTKKGNYKAKIAYKGDNCYNKATGKANIIIKK